MIDRTGRVVINPSVGMGVTDFQRLYMGEGRSPSEAASFIHLNYPMEAKSHLEKQWRNLGINDSPERFFANPSNLAMLDGGTEQAIRRTNDMMGPARAVPQAAARMAPSLGAVAGSGAAGSNMAQLALLQLQQQNDAAGRILDAQPSMDVRQAANRAVPMPIMGMDDQSLLRSQQAGDSGFARKFLARQSGIQNYDEWIAKPMADPNWLERDPRYRSNDDIKPYRPTNLGPLGGGVGRLDSRVFGDPEFQDLYARDPDAAAYAYQRLTGRDLKGDYDETTKLRKETHDAGRRYAQKAIEDGAQYDANSGRWMVWNVSEAPDQTNQLTGTTPRPYRQRTRATDEQQHWLNQHYEGIMGQPMDGGPKMGRKESKDILQLAQKDKELGDRISAEERRMGGPLLPAEIQKIKHDIDVARIAGQQPTLFGSTNVHKIAEGMEMSARNLTGQGADETINKGNNFYQDFYNEYLGADMVDLPFIGKYMPRSVGNQFAPRPVQPAAKPKVMQVQDFDPITRQPVTRTVTVDPITGGILKR